MAANTSIEWATHTFNMAWGCQKVSPGCTGCYAETWANRYGFDVWGPAKTTGRRTFGEKHWNEPLKWERDAAKRGARARVFCSSMADVFEDHPAYETERPKLWTLIEQTPHLDWLLLTKRPENMYRMLPPAWRAEPRLNVWLGTSTENQEWFDRRIDALLGTPARVHFLSAEPLLGLIDMRGYRPSWVIVGCESGHGARPMDEAWVRGLRDQCQDAGMAFFYKQKLAMGQKVSTPELDGRQWIEFPRITASLNGH